MSKTHETEIAAATTMPAMVTLRDVFTRETRAMRISEFDAIGLHSSKLFDRCKNSSVHAAIGFNKFIENGGTSVGLRQEDIDSAYDYMQSPIRKLFNSEFITDGQRARFKPLLERDTAQILAMHRAYKEVKAAVEASDKTLSYIAEDKNDGVGHRNTYVDETPEEIAEAAINAQAEILARAMKLAR